MALFDAIHQAFQTAQNFKRVGILGNATHGHFALRGLAADPTTSQHYEGRFWFRASKAGLYFRGLVKTGSYGTLKLPGVLQGENATADPASLADGANRLTTITVTNAELGDFCLPSASVSQVGMSVTCYVSAADTVTISEQNESGGAVDLATRVLSAMVFKKV